MAPVVPDKKKIRSFRTEAGFERWLSKHHDRETEIWVRIYKKDSGVATVTAPQALDVALCWGWIDGIRKSCDEESFLQRYTPRRARSLWSQVNRDNVARLIHAGRMTPHGLAQVDAAKAGRPMGCGVPADPQRVRRQHPRRPARRDRRQPEGTKDVRDAGENEPVRAGVPDEQHEDGRRAGAEDRRSRGNARAGRDDRPGGAASRAAAKDGSRCR